MDRKIVENYKKLTPHLFILPTLLLAALVAYLYSQQALSVEGYPQIQKEYFMDINHALGQYSLLQHNLTQLGDGLIVLALLSIFVVYAPKVWEFLLSGMLVSGIFSAVLKKLLSVPRPAAAYDADSFFIIGKRLAGFNSTPSGHSITVFVVITVLLFVFMPRKWYAKILWSTGIIAMGFALSTSRVAVGAHYPLDVLSGAIIGYISGIIGIFISRKYKVWTWMSQVKFYPFFIVLFLVGFVLLVTRIAHHNLFIYYLSLISLIISLYKIITIYVESIKKQRSENIKK